MMTIITSNNRQPTNARMRGAAALLFAAVGFAVALPAPANAADNDLPLKDIILYRSGVGYFERRGQVLGTETVNLSFNVDQLDDLLKSLVLLDLDGGEIDAVSYAPETSLDERLKGFAIDVRRADSMPALFQQLRGAEVNVLADTDITGTIFAVEQRDTTAATGNTAREWWVTLVTRTGLRSIPFSNIRTFTLLDDELASELTQALAALAEARNDSARDVNVTFRGAEGTSRRILAAYVHAMPVWKTSYRMVLPEEGQGLPTLQGWAIVENTTDQDWTDVNLSLASGRPVSFTMDLGAPVYLTRPDVDVPVESVLTARTYEGDIARRVLRERAAGQPADAPASSGRFLKSPPPGRGGGANLATLGESMQDAEFGVGLANMGDYGPSAQAAGADVGEQFMYSITSPVTLQRGKSAMLPIITTAVEGRRLSIYNAADGSPHPMRGAEFNNDSDLHLLPGPIAVFDGEAYAGDAQIPHTSRGQTRLISYALDLDVQITPEQRFDANIVSVRIVDGLLEQTYERESSTTYRITNNDASKGRTLMIEHPRLTQWELITPDEPEQETANLYRFETAIEPGEVDEFVVTQRTTDRTAFALVNMNLTELLAFQRDGKASQAVVDAARKAQQIQRRINEARERSQRLSNERNLISQDQTRIRGNMGALDRQSELYNSYVTKLTEQETRLEAILQESQQAENDRLTAERELQAFLRDLDVR